jgi:hypothetical protein
LITQFHLIALIALINVIFKIISRAYATCLDPIANQIISPNQTFFIKGKNILDGPLALIEIVHEPRHQKARGDPHEVRFREGVRPRELRFSRGSAMLQRF